MQCSFEEKGTYPNGAHYHSMCTNKAQILFVNDPCYGLCYSCAYKQLRTENEEKQELIDHLCSQEPCPKCGYGVTGQCYGCIIKQLRTENEKLKKAIEKIRKWQQAYPLGVFPEPDFQKAHKVLKAAGMTLDAISASNMRHVINGVRDIVEQALKEPDDES